MLGSGEGNVATSAAVVYSAAELSHRAAVLGALEKTAALNGYMPDEDEDWSETDDEEESDDCSFSDESSASSSKVHRQKEVRLCVSTLPPIIAHLTIIIEASE